MEQPDIMKPPPDCPNCHGQTEWTQLPNGKYVAMCMFCGCVFSDGTEHQSKDCRDSSSEVKHDL